MGIMGYVIGVLIWSVICGFIGRAIVSGKGYSDSENHGFAWGFWLEIIGIIVCACKTDVNYIKRLSKSNESTSTPDSALSAYAKEKNEQDILKNGGWKCNSCGRVNASYITICPCGVLAKDNLALGDKKNGIDKNTDAEEIAKYKKMVDDGLISEEEFQAKKKQILGI